MISSLLGFADFQSSCIFARLIFQYLSRYAPPHPRGTWPLCANILDPIRVSVVVAGGAGNIVQVLSAPQYVDK